MYGTTNPDYGVDYNILLFVFETKLYAFSFTDKNVKNITTIPSLPLHKKVQTKSVCLHWVYAILLWLKELRSSGKVRVMLVRESRESITNYMTLR